MIRKRLLAVRLSLDFFPTQETAMLWANKPYASVMSAGYIKQLEQLQFVYGTALIMVNPLDGLHSQRAGTPAP